MPIIGANKQSAGDANQQHLIIEAHTKSMQENLAQKNPNPMLLSNHINNLIDYCEITQKQIADILGKSEAWVCQIRRLKKLPREVHHLIEKGQVTMLEAQKILQIPDKEKHKQLAELCAQGLSNKELDDKIKQILQPTLEQSQMTKTQVNPYENSIRSIDETLEKETKITIKNEIARCFTAHFRDINICDGNCKVCQNSDNYCQGILKAYFNLGIKSPLVR